jgi:hypothetical protein
MEQLALRAGQVRCGHCHTVFDGVAALVSLAPRTVREQNEPEFDEDALGPPTVTLRSSQALQPPPHTVDASEDRTEPNIGDVAADEEIESSGDSYATRFSWQERRERRKAPAWAYAIAIPALVLLLVAQALFHFRDAIAAHWPASKPALITLCSTAGCVLHPLQDITGLSIESSDLQADPAHKGLLIMTATLRNRAAHPLAYPYVELTLTDTGDHIVVRRAFAPQDYAGGTADLESGISGNSEFALKLFVDASATTQAGYQVYLFYP